MTKAPDYREGKIADLAHGTAMYMRDLVKENRDAFPTCLNCAYFNEAAAFCTKFNANPPPRIIVYACAGYADVDAVPY